MKRGAKAIVAADPIAPMSWEDDKLLETDWDEIDAFGLMAEIGPFDGLRPES